MGSKEQLEATWILEESALRRLIEETPSGTERRVPAGEVINALSPTYAEKIICLDIHKQAEQDDILLVFHRLDAEVDPIAVDYDLLVAHPASPSGCWIYHSGFDGRTTPVDPARLGGTNTETLTNLRSCVTPKTSDLYPTGNDIHDYRKKAPAKLQACETRLKTDVRYRERFLRQRMK